MSEAEVRARGRGEGGPSTHSLVCASAGLLGVQAQAAEGSVHPHTQQGRRLGVHQGERHRRAPPGPPPPALDPRPAFPHDSPGVPPWAADTPTGFLTHAGRRNFLSFLALRWRSALPSGGHRRQRHHERGAPAHAGLRSRAGRGARVDTPGSMQKLASPTTMHHPASHAHGGTLLAEKGLLVAPSPFSSDPLGI